MEREGFVLAGFVSEKPVHGSFVAGYVPGKQRGTVTRAKGRVILEIDHEPAAVVYNRWRAGAVSELYRKAIGGAPFVGAATFGEIGCFTGPSPVNRHGNLMCDTILFE